MDMDMQLSPSDFSSCLQYEASFRKNSNPAAFGDFATLTFDGLADYTFSPVLFAAGDDKEKMGPLTCTYLVKNDVNGDGVVFSSYSIMPGVSLRISDLANSSDCVGPVRTTPPKPGTSYSCSKIVGTISSDSGSLEIKTMSNLVMVEASFNPLTNYSVPVNTSVFTAQAGAPDQCSEVVANGGCTRKYALAYGCKTTLFSLPFDDPCYTDVTFNKCVASTWSCGGCLMVCSSVQSSMQQDQSYDPNSHMGWDLCGAVCDMVTAGNKSIASPTDNFCAPGCEKSDIADGICNPECFNTACFNDGGDCSGASVDSVYAPLRVVHAYSHLTFSLLDLKGTDGLVTREEFYTAMYPNGLENDRDPLWGMFDDMMTELRIKWGMGLDPIAFSSLTQFRSPLELIEAALYAGGDSGQGTGNGSAMNQSYQGPVNQSGQGADLPPSLEKSDVTRISIDDIMDSVEALNEFAIGRAANLLRLFDVNLNGEFDPEELYKVNPNLDMAALENLNRGGLYGNDEDEGVSEGKDATFHGPANLMANILFGVYVSLSGRTLKEPAFDNEGATRSMITMFDRDADERLSLSEISLAGISPSMAFAIDINADGMVDVRELLHAQTRMIESGCAGTTVISDRHKVITTKPPLTGQSPRSCNFLVLPSWFYARVVEESDGPPASGRRKHGAVLADGSGQVLAKATTVSQEEQKTVSYWRKRAPAAVAAAQVHAPAAASRRRSEAGDRRDWHGDSSMEHGQGASAFERGEPVNLVSRGMDFVVEVFVNNSVACMGAMISNDVVLISGSCSSKFPSIDPYMSLDQFVHVQDVHGNVFWPSSISISPNVTVGANAFAMMRLTRMWEGSAVELHDGLIEGLRASDCSDDGRLIAVGIQTVIDSVQHPGDVDMNTSEPSLNTSEPSLNTSEPSFMAQQPMDVAKKSDCVDDYGLARRVNPVLDRHTCGVPFNGASKMCFADGHLLLARHPENRSKWVLVGVADGQNDGCHSPLSQLPTLYSEISHQLPWILSHKGLGRFPPRMLSVEASHLSLAAGDEVRVLAKDSQDAGSMISSKLENGGIYHDTAGAGSINIVISSPPMRGQVYSKIKLTVGVSGCGGSTLMGEGTDAGHNGDESWFPDGNATGYPGGNATGSEGGGRRNGNATGYPDGNATGYPDGNFTGYSDGNSTGFPCESFEGCELGPGGECGSKTCEFSPGWKGVLLLQAEGKAFTGGLGQEVQVTDSKSYHQWMCARDWNVEEQLACGLGPGEIGCFRFNKKADKGSGFDWYGRNAERRLVSESKQKHSTSLG